MLVLMKVTLLMASLATAMPTALAPREIECMHPGSDCITLPNGDKCAIQCSWTVHGSNLALTDFEKCTPHETCVFKDTDTPTFCSASPLPVNIRVNRVVEPQLPPTSSSEPPASQEPADNDRHLTTTAALLPVKTRLSDLVKLLGDPQLQLPPIPRSGHGAPVPQKPTDDDVRSRMTAIMPANNRASDLVKLAGDPRLPPLSLTGRSPSISSPDNLPSPVEIVAHNSTDDDENKPSQEVITHPKNHEEKVTSKSDGHHDQHLRFKLEYDYSCHGKEEDRVEDKSHQ